MQIAVISDLHLGAGGPTDLFGHDDHEFLSFLTFLEKNFERIVLLGDIWETLTSRVPGGAARQLAAARRAHPEIDRRFRKAQYTYVHGNHDFVASSTDRAPEEFSIQAGGVRLLFTHGHQSDPLLRCARWASELGVWIGGWIRRIGLVGAYDLLARIDQARSGHRDLMDCSVHRWALTHGAEREADVVVTGHTHFAVRREHGSRLYLNSGSCAEGAFSFLSIDTARGAYTVHGAW